MYNIRITLCEKRPAPAESAEEFVLADVCSLWAERTEDGGRENLYASRIVHRNEVVYTVRYRPFVRSSMYIREGERYLRIAGIQEEGRKEKLHIRAVKDDTGDAYETEG